MQLKSEVAKPRLAILSRNFARTAGGAEAYAVSLAQALSHQYDITVFAQRFGGSIDTISFQKVPDGQWLPRWINQLWYSLAVVWLSRGFELVHSHENTITGNFQTIHVMTVHASLQARLRSKGWLCTKLKLCLSPRIWAYLWLEKARILGPHRTVIFASQALLTETTAAMGAIANTSVAPPGVQLINTDTRITPASVNHRTSELLFVANDYEKKGLAVLLEAMQILKKRRIQTQLKIAGKPTMQARFNAKAIQLGIATELEFLGSVQNMAALYASADMLVHPTTQDVFPMVVLESMGNHLPVITTAAPYNSMGNLLTHRENALLLQDPRDAQTLADLIQACIESPDLRSSLATGGYDFAKNYDWKKLAEQHHALYQKVLLTAKSSV